MVLLPRLPGEPSSVEADPRMLPTLENVKKRSKDRERKKLEGRQRGEQSQESLDERLLPLHLNHELDTINYQLDLLYLGGAQTVSVGDVEHTTHGGSVHTTCATLLQTQPGEDLLKLGVCAQLGQLDMDTTTQTGTKIGGAGEDVAEMLVPHEAVVVLLEDLLNLLQANTETPEDLPHVAALLHGDDTQVILLVHPDQEGFVVVVPDASGVRPVTGHTSAGQQGRDRLVKQEVISDQLLLLGISHGLQGVVLSLELTIQAGQSLNGQLLNQSALATAVVGGQGQSLDAATSTDTAGQDIVGVQVVTALQVLEVQVGLVLVSGLVSTMTIGDDRVQQLLEDLIGLLITSDAANSQDDVIQGVATGCLPVPQLAIDLLGQDLGHVVVVLGQVGELLLNFVVEFEVVVGVSERHDCFLTLHTRQEQR